MLKNFWDELPYFYRQIFKLRKRGLFQMPALFFSKDNFAQVGEEWPIFFSMQSIEFSPAQQQRNVFDDLLPFHANMSRALRLKWF